MVRSRVRKLILDDVALRMKDGTLNRLWLFWRGGVVRVKKLSRSGISLHDIWELMCCRHLPVMRHKKAFDGTVSIE